MTGFWPIFFLLVVLKIPVFGVALAGLVGEQGTPEPDEAAEDSDGGFKRRPAAAQPARAARAAEPHGSGAATPLPATARQAGAPGCVRPAAAACFRSRRISRR